jgi:hypothetical protein
MITSWRKLRDVLFPEEPFSTFDTKNHGVSERGEGKESETSSASDMVNSVKRSFPLSMVNSVKSQNSMVNSANSAESLEDLKASANRLEAAGIRIAVWDTGEMRVLMSEGDTRMAIHAGGTPYSPDEMLHFCVDLTLEERKLLHGLKRLT